MSKFYLIAGTIFTFNMIISVLNSLHLGYYMPYDASWYSKVQQAGQSANKYTGNAILDTVMLIGDFISMLPLFIQAFFYATVYLPVLLANLGITGAWNTFITALSWFSYLGAIIEFISGRVIER